MTAILELRGIRKSLGGTVVLDGVNLRLEPGEILALVGPNGAGKTSVMNIVSRMTTPDAGDVLVDGDSILGTPAHRLAAKGIARVFQVSRLSPELAVGDHIALGSYFRRTPLHALLPALGKARLKPRDGCALIARITKTLGMDGMEDRRAGALSHRQRRSVELLRAIAGTPRLLLLDEPTAGMTDEEREPVRSSIAELRNAGVAILLVEHDVALTAAVADRCVLLQAGQVLRDGPAATILSSPEMRSVYLGS